MDLYSGLLFIPHDAHIIKIAMNHIDEELLAHREAGGRAQMVLQVHDELLFEVPESELDRTAEVVSAVMESAAWPARELQVPLTVDVGYGENWAVAH